MKLLIATKNQGKFKEIKETLGRLPLELLSLSDLGLDHDVEETGLTHRENAILKARYFYNEALIPVLAEDSGIELSAFPGELGVCTRRWNGLKSASDEEWIKHFLGRMENVPNSRRGAKFICWAALIINDAEFERPRLFSGETSGVITKTLEAPVSAGIPISSCFKPEGFDKVYAALAVEEKNKISHRGKAMQKAARELSIFLRGVAQLV